MMADGRDAQLGHAIAVEFDVHDLGLHPEEIHPRHALTSDSSLRRNSPTFLELGVGIAITGDGEEDAVDVAEVVVHQ